MFTRSFFPAAIPIRREFINNHIENPLTSKTSIALQEDVLPGTSTVFEYLLFHANLRLPKTVPATQKELMVYSVIKQLGLEKVGHNLVGDEYTRGLSGRAAPHALDNPY